MSDTQITPDDPRLTAFALGELDGEEARVIAAAVARDPILQAAVEDVRALAGDLAGAFAAEALPEVSAMNLAQEENELYPLDSRKIRRFPYFWVAGLMAAGFAVLVVVFDPGSSRGPRDQVVIYDLDLSQLPGRGPEVVPLPPVLVEISREDVRKAWAPWQGAADGGRVWSRDESLPVSRFPLWVNTAGYDEVRRSIESGLRPAPQSVRIEEMINAFAYDYEAPPPDALAPVAAHVEVAAAPWAPEHKLVRVGLKAREFPADLSPAAMVAEHLGVRVEFNPQRVASYQILGYERQDQALVDEAQPAQTGTMLRAGQEITVLYEVVPHAPGRLLEGGEAGADAALLFVHVWAKSVVADAPAEWSFPLADADHAFAAASSDFRFAASVAGFGLALRDALPRGAIQLADVRRWAEAAREYDPDGQRSAFIDLIDRAEGVMRM